MGVDEEDFVSMLLTFVAVKQFSKIHKKSVSMSDHDEMVEHQEEKDGYLLEFL